MLKNYLIIAIRNLGRHRGYAAINLAGLAVGLACCLMIVLFVRNEWSFDRFHTHAERTYRITTTLKLGDNTVPMIAPGPLGPTLVDELPGVTHAARVRCLDAALTVRREAERFDAPGICFADPSLFDVFDFTLRTGDPQTALARPYSLVLSPALARTYFGDRDPVGQVLEIDGEHSYEVTGVLDLPAGNTHLNFGLLASFSTYAALEPLVETWADGGANPYVVLAPGYSADALQAHLDEHLDDYMGYFATGVTAHLEPLQGIYFFSDFPPTTAEVRGELDYLYLFATAALLILLIACINYMNLATARSMRRAREVGMRKALGATRGQLVRQFLSESILLSGLAFFVALALVLWLLPHFGTLTGRTLEVHRLLDGPVLLGFALITLAVGVFAGSYPAFYLARFEPVRVLKGRSFDGRGGRGLRRGLVVVQFAVSIGLAAGTVVLWNQLDFARNARLGFDKEHVVVIAPTEEVEGQYAAFKQELLALPDVVGVTTAPMPGHTHVAISSHRVEGHDVETEGVPWVAQFDVDEDFLDVLGVELVAGRNFDPALGADRDGAILVTESTARHFGWEEPLGKWIQKPRREGGVMQLNERRVVGVVKDFQTWTLKWERKPIFIYPTETVGRFGNVLVKIRPGDVPGTLARLEGVWADFEPNRVFDFAFLDQEIDQFYRADMRFGRLLGVFSVLAVVIACLGLFGLAAFMAEQRTKEIGIRKVFGASVPAIIRLLCTDYLVLVSLAFCVAAPLTYLVMRRWLDGFAVSVGIGWQTLALVGVGALLVALLTVGYQSIRAALTNPVKALRYE